ncbi:hypothetical protein [Cohnella sp. REN36]|uniref:hypothetical protein n=1 Tax=Cohnella sp. REN36 TaxID=2887347 RepID=UPI001D141398|nr:hypothetical protein [Cohnella sp. REN36]MCC3374572.1 hypothetical protein [Cohnella sp. REN36]
MSPLESAGLVVVCGLFLFFLGVYLRYARRKKRVLDRLFDRVRLQDGRMPGAILFLHPGRGETDALEPLVPVLPADWVVIYDGPPWLTEMKGRRWGREIRSRSVCLPEPLTLWEDTMLIRRGRWGGYAFFYEVQALAERIAAVSR